MSPIQAVILKVHTGTLANGTASIDMVCSIDGTLIMASRLLQSRTDELGVLEGVPPFTSFAMAGYVGALHGGRAQS